MKLAFPLLLAVGLSAATEAIADSPKRELSDWLSHYYRNPTPGRLPGWVREAADDRFLSKMIADRKRNTPIVAFLSRVMADNPDHVVGWLIELESLSAPIRAAVRKAAWMSGTQTARDYFRQRELVKHVEHQPPNILAQEVRSPDTLDMLWAHFFASGDKKPVARVISAFALSKHSGAKKRYMESEEKTEELRQEALLEITFEAARWSLESNCRQHPLVLKHSEELFASDTLTSSEGLWLGVVLAKVKPNNYQIEVDKLPSEESIQP